MSTRWAVAGRLVGYSTPHGVCSSTRRSHGLLTPPSIDATFGLAAWSLLACCAPSQGSEAKGLQFHVLISRSVLQPFLCLSRTWNHESSPCRYHRSGAAKKGRPQLLSELIFKASSMDSITLPRWTASLFRSKL